MAEREYVRVRRVVGDWDDGHRAVDSLARTVHEDFELVDIGILDADGERVMARKRMDPIGFIRWRHG